MKPLGYGFSERMVLWNMAVNTFATGMFYDDPHSVTVCYVLWRPVHEQGVAWGLSPH